MPAPIDEDRILKAGLAVWRELGFRDATTRKVAERAGVGEVTIFRRFGDKSSLFARALETEADRFAAVAVGHTGHLRADLVAATRAYQALLDEDGAIVLDFLLEAPKNAQLRAVSPAPLRAVGAVAQMIARHQAEGRLRPGDPMGLVLQLFGPLVMRYALRKAQPTLPLDVAPEAIVDGFIRGFAPSDEAARGS